MHNWVGRACVFVLQFLWSLNTANWFLIKFRIEEVRSKLYRVNSILIQNIGSG